MTKDELKAALDEKGIAYNDDATNADLEALLDGGDKPGTLPADSLERGSRASTYEDAPDKPDDSTIAQIEKLPGE